MNYLVFNGNLRNSLVVSGIQKVYCCEKDFSVFEIEKDDFYAHIRCGRHGMPLTKKDGLFQDSIVILSSKNPVDICGLCASVSFLSRLGLEILVSCPKSPNILEYGDLPPEEILRLVTKNSVSLSEETTEGICDAWEKAVHGGTNLRIWSKEKIVQSVEDNFFDSDIQSVIEKQGTVQDNLLRNIQCCLREKYQIGMNPKFLKWRIAVLKELAARPFQ